MKEETTVKKYENLLWIVFWICLFSYFSYDLYLDNQLKITKSNNEVKLKEAENEILKNSLRQIHAVPDSSVK